MKASEVIRETKNVLFKRGWHQGSMVGLDGSVCIEGACRAVTHGICNDVAWDAIREAVAERFGFAVGPPTFNDIPGRTFDEIIDVLDRAEKLALLAEEAELSDA